MSDSESVSESDRDWDSHSLSACSNSGSDLEAQAQAKEEKVNLNVKSKGEEDDINVNTSASMNMKRHNHTQHNQVGKDENKQAKKGAPSQIAIIAFTIGAVLLVVIATISTVLICCCCCNRNSQSKQMQIKAPTASTHHLRSSTFSNDKDIFQNSNTNVAKAQGNQGDKIKNSPAIQVQLQEKKKLRDVDSDKSIKTSTDSDASVAKPKDQETEGGTGSRTTNINTNGQIIGKGGKTKTKNRKVRPKQANVNGLTKPKVNLKNVGTGATQQTTPQNQMQQLKQQEKGTPLNLKWKSQKQQEDGKNKKKGAQTQLTNLLKNGEQKKLDEEVQKPMETTSTQQAVNQKKSTQQNTAKKNDSNTTSTKVTNQGEGPVELDPEQKWRQEWNQVTTYLKAEALKLSELKSLYLESHGQNRKQREENLSWEFLKDMEGLEEFFWHSFDDKVADGSPKNPIRTIFTYLQELVDQWEKLTENLEWMKENIRFEFDVSDSDKDNSNSFTSLSLHHFLGEIKKQAFVILDAALKWNWIRKKRNITITKKIRETYYAKLTQLILKEFEQSKEYQDSKMIMKMKTNQDQPNKLSSNSKSISFAVSLLDLLKTYGILPYAIDNVLEKYVKKAEKAKWHAQEQLDKMMKVGNQHYVYFSKEDKETPQYKNWDKRRDKESTMQLISNDWECNRHMFRISSSFAMQKTNKYRNDVINAAKALQGLALLDMIYDKHKGERENEINGVNESGNGRV